MHSGTTLLQDILGRHPSLFSGRGESKYFEFLPTIRQRHPDLTLDRTRRELVETAIRAAIGGFSATGILRPRPPGAVDVLAEVSSTLVHRIEADVASSRDHGEIFRVVCERDRKSVV